MYMDDNVIDVQPKIVVAPGSNPADNSAPAEIVPAKKKRKPGGKPFVKGDPRINRKGNKIKPYLHLVEMAQTIGAMKVLGTDGKMHEINEIILIDMARSKDFNKQAKFLAYQFGNIPDSFDWDKAGEALKAAGLSDSDLANRIVAILSLARERLARKRIEEDTKDV